MFLIFFATLLCLGVKDKQLKRINRRRRPNVGKLAKLSQNSPHTVRQGLFFSPRGKGRVENEMKRVKEEKTHGARMKGAGN